MDEPKVVEVVHMKKEIHILYYITVVISALVGLWHFFVPWMFQWYDYLPRTVLTADSILLYVIM